MLFKILAALLLAAACAAPLPAAANGYVWDVTTGPEGVYIKLAVPETSNFALIVGCKPGTGIGEVTSYLRLKGARTGQPVDIAFSVGTRTVTIKGRTTTDEMRGSIYGEAKNAKIAELAALLRAPGALTVRMRSATHSYPEQDRRSRAEAFEKACRLPS